MTRIQTLQEPISLECGKLFRLATTVFRIIDRHVDLLILEHAVTLERKSILEEKLLSAYLAGELFPADDVGISRAARQDLFLEDESRQFSPPLPHLSKATIKSGLSKRFYIGELRKIGYTSLRPTTLLQLDLERLAREKGDPNPPQVSTIYTASRKLDTYGGDARVLFPNFKDRGGHGQLRWNPQADREFVEIVEQIRKDKKRKIKSSEIESRIFDALTEKLGTESAIPATPSRSSISRRIKSEFGQYEVDLRNRGKAYVDRAYRSWAPRDRSRVPLAVIEFDDKDSRVFLIDDQTLLPCGRGYITSGVDQATSMFLGGSIDDSHRSLLSAKAAYVNSILPFDIADEQYAAVKHLPNVYGQTGLAIFDNALYNHAPDLEATVYELSPDAGIAWSKPYTPTEKSTVEDFNGWLVNHLSTLPGFGGPKGTVKDLTQGVDSAVMTASDFQRNLFKWIFDEYANTPRAAGLSPLQQWHQGLANVRQRLPADVMRARQLLMIQKSLRLRPEGVSLGDGLCYRNPRLDVIRRKLGNNAKVLLRFNPRNLEFILVMDPETKLNFQVQSTNPQLTSRLTMYQYKLVRKMCAMQKRHNPSLREMLQAKDELAKISTQLRWSKKKRERQLGKRAANDQPNTSQEPEIITELEATVDEILVTDIQPAEELDCDLSLL